MYYLAVDIGASSGRHIIGYTENGKLILDADDFMRRDVNDFIHINSEEKEQ